MGHTEASHIMKPHIVLILADDYGWSNAGWHRANDSEVRTPVMDTLVSDGIELDRHYVFKFCSPSRSALQTGRNPTHVNVNNYMPIMHNPADPVSGYSAIPRNMTGLATLMRRAGCEGSSVAPLTTHHSLASHHSPHTTLQIPLRWLASGTRVRQRSTIRLRAVATSAPSFTSTIAMTTGRVLLASRAPAHLAAFRGVRSPSRPIGVSHMPLSSAVDIWLGGTTWAHRGRPPCPMPPPGVPLIGRVAASASVHASLNHWPSRGCTSTSRISRALPTLLLTRAAHGLCVRAWPLILPNPCSVYKQPKHASVRSIPARHSATCTWMTGLPPVGTFRRSHSARANRTR